MSNNMKTMADRFGRWAYDRSWAFSDSAHGFFDRLEAKHGRERIDTVLKRVEEFIKEDGDFDTWMQQKQESFGAWYDDLENNPHAGGVIDVLTHPVAISIAGGLSRVVNRAYDAETEAMIRSVIKDLLDVIGESFEKKIERLAETITRTILQAHVDRGKVIMARGRIHVMSELAHRKRSHAHERLGFSPTEVDWYIEHQHLLHKGTACLILGDLIPREPTHHARAWRDARVLVLAHGARYYVNAWELIYTGF